MLLEQPVRYQKVSAHSFFNGDVSSATIRGYIPRDIPSEEIIKNFFLSFLYLFAGPSLGFVMDSLLAAIERGQRKFVCEEFSVEFAPSWDIEELRARVSSHWRNYHETGMSSLGGGSRVLPGFVPNTRPSRVVILALTREPPSGSDVLLFLKAVRRELCPGVYLCSSRSRKRKKDESTAAESYGSYFTPNLETRAEMYRLRS